VEAATGSRGVIAGALLASGRVLSQINTWPRARASKRSFLCASLFFSSLIHFPLFYLVK